MTEVMGPVAIERNCPRCGSAIIEQVAQLSRRGKLYWYKTIKCDTCGLNEEVDGSGMPSKELRESIIRMQGMWQLAIDSNSSIPIIAKVLRESLSLDAKEAIRLTRNNPPVVYIGTNGECHWLKKLLENAGQIAYLEKIDSVAN